MAPLSSQLFVHYSKLSSCAKRRKQDPKVDEAGRRWCHLETTAERKNTVQKKNQYLRNDLCTNRNFHRAQRGRNRTRKSTKRDDDGATLKQQPKRTKTSRKWRHSLRNCLCTIRIFHRAQRGGNRTQKWTKRDDDGATLKQQPKRTETS